MEANLSWLTDPEVFQINRLDAHSDHVCYAKETELEHGKTSLQQSLDGQWQFWFSRNPAERPEKFWQNGFCDADFSTIQVPGHMELQGYGEIQYINTLYPWDGRAEIRPPQIDWENTHVGSYVKTFDLEPGLWGKRVCISFQGVEQAMFLWCNSQFVGYAEDSFTPSDFDLTPYIQETGNRLCVEVYQRSSAAWLEDQDFFRFSGIFRSVFLYAKPECHVEDVWYQTSLLDTGSLTIRLRLSGQPEQVLFRLCDKEGTVVFNGPLELREQDGYFWSQTLTFADIQPWSHEHPVLYDSLLTLQRGVETEELIPYALGFRRFGIENKVMCLNGKRLVIRGVNRHEWNPRKGRAIGREDMERAKDTFLRNNINAVRTCHYPNQSYWYQLCDQNGIYVMDETNLESHGSWQKLGKIEPSWNVPGSLLQWRACVLDRAKNMFERDKNHVSILFWSCGNESYAGEDILAMADYFRAVDPSRLVHYEGAVHNRAFDAISDVESRMYASPAAIREYLENDPPKPFLLCEYMHDMGNSLGGMESYIRLGEEFPMYQGGFIWDYMDQALWHTNDKGETVLGYGGDFLDRQTDYSFSGDGIVFADGTEKPAMQEVRYWYADEKFRAAQDAANQAAMAQIPQVVSRAGEPLKLVHGDGALGVWGEDFHVLFSYPEGGPCSIVSGGEEWLWRAPRAAYWRAPTENDLGNSFAVNSSVWSAVDRWQKCTDVQILEENPARVVIRYSYTAPAMADLETQITYSVGADGTMNVRVYYHGGEKRPPLPLLGLRFATPQKLDSVAWAGLSGETYPDRKKGGIFGNWQEVPHVPDYLVPQECGCHMDTHQTVLHRDEHCLTLHMGSKPYAFSALPYTPQELEAAFHKDELPEPCRTVITVCGAMRGVGGIDSWGSDVEEAYRIDAAADIEFDFQIQLSQISGRISF